MKRSVFAAALLLASCAAPGPEQPPTRGSDAAPAGPVTAAAVAEGNAGMGVSLYKRLIAEPGNVFVSPISIAGAFGPVVAGAEGETRAAIARTLGFPGGGGAGLHPELGALLRRLERSREGTTVSIANALWVKNDFALRPEFAATARRDYDSTVERLDFAGAPGPSAKRINDWVSGETRGRIRDLISRDSLNAFTRLVVTNAVYFLGDWAEPFDAADTAEQPFYGRGADIRQVPLMYMKNSFRYFETPSFQAVDLPYKDERLSMSVFLPKKRDGLGAFERELDERRLKAWLAQLDAGEPREVQLYLPKLRIEESYNLVPALREMGMGVAFDPGKADLRGIADADLFISQVVHKSFVRIDEKGTEAAAATGLSIEVTGMRINPPPVFRADHPFFFLLRDKESGAILFLGRIEAPERPDA